jgi:hypothetical protein
VPTWRRPARRGRRAGGAEEDPRRAGELAVGFVPFGAGPRGAGPGWQGPKPMRVNGRYIGTVDARPFSARCCPACRARTWRGGVRKA